MKKQVGFNLIELMIVVAVIAILAAIAAPRYQRNVVNANRASVQGDLQSAAAAMAAYRSQNFTYSGATLLGSSGVLKNPSSAPYNLAFSTGATNTAAQTYIIYATPKSGSRQVGNGALGINQNGERCWNKSSDTTCTPGDSGQAWD
ncbi:MAG: type IV pilin protein [Pedobacter sp.]|nr:type IV pilin protein [Pedobacter sp.]